jgi:hypothetical protein
MTLAKPLVTNDGCMHVMAMLSQCKLLQLEAGWLLPSKIQNVFPAFEEVRRTREIPCLAFH